MGWALLQIGLAVGIAWPSPSSSAAAAWPPYLLVALGAIFAGWTFVHNRPGNFQVAPAVKPGAKLVLTGPYRLVRHPMYLAILLLFGGVAWRDGHWVDGVGWLALLGVFLAKIPREERLLRERWPEYAVYAARVGMLWPTVRRARPPNDGRSG